MKAEARGLLLWTPEACFCSRHPSLSLFNQRVPKCPCLCPNPRRSFGLQRLCPGPLSCDPNAGKGAGGVGRSGRGSEHSHTSLGTCGLQVVSPWVVSKLPPQKVSLREAHTALRSASSKYTVGTILLAALGCMSLTMIALHQPPAHMCPGRQCRTWETVGPSPPSVGLTWRGGRGSCVAGAAVWPEQAGRRLLWAGGMMTLTHSVKSEARFPEVPASQF